MHGGIHGGRCTLSRISTRLSTSARLNGGKLFGACSARDTMETTKGINCDSTPSLTRSSGAMGGKSGEGLASLVGCAHTLGMGPTLGDLGSNGHVDLRAGRREDNSGRKYKTLRWRVS